VTKIKAVSEDEPEDLFESPPIKFRENQPLLEEVSRVYSYLKR